MGKSNQNRRISEMQIARFVAGVSVDDLVKALGGVKGRMYFYRLEKGESARITMEIAEKIAHTVKVPVEKLFPSMEKNRND